jgi:hypothetical protein
VDVPGASSFCVCVGCVRVVCKRPWMGEGYTHVCEGGLCSGGGGGGGAGVEAAVGAHCDAPKPPHLTPSRVPTFLYHHRAGADDVEPWCIQCALRIHPQINHIAQNLDHHNRPRHRHQLLVANDTRTPQRAHPTTHTAAHPPRKPEPQRCTHTPPGTGAHADPFPTPPPVTCRCPWGCMKPPMTENVANRRPSCSASPGMMVWYGRLPPATTFGCPASARRMERTPTPGQRRGEGGREGRDLRPVRPQSRYVTARAPTWAHHPGKKIPHPPPPQTHTPSGPAPHPFQAPPPKSHPSSTTTPE